MDDLITEVEHLLNIPVKQFTIAGITEEGNLVDIEFSFNMFKHLTESVYPDESFCWSIVPKEKYSEFGIHLNSAAVRFNRQTLTEMRNRNIFLDLTILENKINELKKTKMGCTKFVEYRTNFLKIILANIKKKLSKI